MDRETADGETVTCPMDCPACREPGDCEDCLDCLYWPRTIDDTPNVVPTRPGPTAPTLSPQLAAARAGLGPGRRVGLVSRRFRRDHQLTQRELARSLGWSRAAVGRIESDASGTPLGRVEALLRDLGYRLAIVPDTGAADELGEEPDEVWGAPDLLARDGQGRRLPPYGRVTWNCVLDRRLYARIVGHEAEWTWHRPADGQGPS